MRGMAKRVGGFTSHRDGYVKWYKGKTRFIAGKSTPIDQLDDVWGALKKLIDAGDAPARRRPGGLNLRELSAAFFAHLDHRRATGRPKPISTRMVHNYKVDVNAFGAAVGGATLIAEIDPDHFAAFAATIAGQKASGYASKVSHVRALFNWAVKMEYLDRARFGPGFVVPSKQQIRDERIVKPKSFDAADVAKLIDGAGQALKSIILLGAVAAMTPGEIATLERGCVDLAAGVIDFRRRKTGRVRRVIPLPPDVAAELRRYVRPAEPLDPVDADLFFLTERGRPYARTRDCGPVNSISILFGRLADDVGVTAHGGGKGFTGLRTTFVNLAPPGTREEVELITGHALGTVLLDHYLERVGLAGLKRVTYHVWETIKTARRHESQPTPAALPSPA